MCIGRHRCPAALREVYGRHGGPAYHLAARVCGPGQAEHVVAGVLHDLWQQPSRFDPDRSSLRSYMLGQAHARVTDLARSARRTGPALTSLAGIARGGDNGPGALGDDVDEHARRLLARLMPDQARAYLGGYSCAELAAHLGVSQMTVTRRLRTALISLGTSSLPEDASVDR